MQISKALNVFGRPLRECCKNPMTGFFRDGSCNTNMFDVGRHLVCIKVTSDFLAFSKQSGNDLSTPMPLSNFPGLKHGDCWCLCVLRCMKSKQQQQQGDHMDSGNEFSFLLSKQGEKHLKQEKRRM